MSSSLGQNYPNPFNPITHIPYVIARQGHVIVELLDALGRHVTTLVDGIEAPGYKSVTFNGARLASGVYYYRLQTRDYAATRKLIFLK